MSKNHHTNLGDIFVAKEKLAVNFFSTMYFYLKYFCLRYCPCFDELASTFARTHSTYTKERSNRMLVTSCCTYWSAELALQAVPIWLIQKVLYPCFVKHPVLGGHCSPTLRSYPHTHSIWGCRVLSHLQISKEMFSPRPEMSNVSFPSWECTPNTRGTNAQPRGFFLTLDLL